MNRLFFHQKKKWTQKTNYDEIVIIKGSEEQKPDGKVTQFV